MAIVALLTSVSCKATAAEPEGSARVEPMRPVQSPHAPLPVRGDPVVVLPRDDAGSNTASTTHGAPLILVLHGYGSTGAGHLGFFGLPSVLTEGAVVVSPQGLVNRESHAQFWNAVPSCCDFEQTGVDDVAYLRGLIGQMIATYHVDPTRISVVGHSNGGALALRMACEAPDLVQRVVAVAPAFFPSAAQCQMGAQGRPVGPVAVAVFHGTHDHVVPFEGGPLRKIHSQATRVPSLGARAIVGLFAERNGCSGSSEAPHLDLDGRATSEGDVRETSHTHYSGCKADVELYAMDGVGHAPAQPSVQFAQEIQRFLLKTAP